MIIRYEKDKHAYKMVPFGPHINGSDEMDPVGEDRYSVHKQSGECLSKGHKSSEDATKWLHEQIGAGNIKARKNSVFYVLWYTRIQPMSGGEFLKSLLETLEKGAEEAAERCGIELAGPVKASLTFDKKRGK